MLIMNALWNEKMHVSNTVLGCQRGIANSKGW
jgi:hypothetical protein